MISLLNYVICFALGSGFAFLFVKKESKPKHKSKLNQLQVNNNLLGIDKLNLQNRNNDLVKIISENQRSIKDLKKDNRELKEDFREITRHQITILQLLSNVTKIRDQADINSQILITDRFAKKYNSYNIFLGSSQTLPETDNSEIYKSD